MRNAVFWIVAILATLWNLFGVYDFTQTFANNQDYLGEFDAEFIAWVQAFPAWRRVVWILALAAGVAGSLALLLRRALAALLLWVATGAMAIGFAGDVTLLGGMDHYGTGGLVFCLVLVAIEALFALYAGWAARQGMLKRP